MTTPDTITRRQTHPAADLFPMMTDDEYTELVESIRTHGQREPVWVDEQGRILDGRNRARACDQLGIPYNWRIYTGSAHPDPQRQTSAKHGPPATNTNPRRPNDTH